MIVLAEYASTRVTVTSGPSESVGGGETAVGAGVGVGGVGERAGAVCAAAECLSTDRPRGPSVPTPMQQATWESRRVSEISWNAL